MIDIRTGMNRRLRVTDDHPVIVWTEGEEEVIPASQVQPGQARRAARASGDSCPALDLIELLAGTR